MRFGRRAVSACRQGNDFSSAGRAQTNVFVVQEFYDCGCIQFLEPREIYFAAKKVAAKGDLPAFFAGRKQAIMPYPYKTFWWDMHQKSSDEFFPGYSKLLPLTLILVILDSICYMSLRQTFDAVVTDGDPVCILAKIFYYGLRAAKWFFTVRHPFLVIADIQ